MHPLVACRVMHRWLVHLTIHTNKCSYVGPTSLQVFANEISISQMNEISEWFFHHSKHFCHSCKIIWEIVRFCRFRRWQFRTVTRYWEGHGFESLETCIDQLHCVVEIVGDLSTFRLSRMTFIKTDLQWNETWMIAWDNWILNKVRSCLCLCIFAYLY